MRELVYNMFIANNHASFTCGEKKICLFIKMCQNIMNIVVSELLGVESPIWLIKV